MNEKINWDSTLVKKFSSSNHYKLLNQLRTEVIKYPLIRKKILNFNESSNYHFDSKNNPNSKTTKVINVSNDSSENIDNYSKQTTISFNNSKNFSIYNNSTNDSNNGDKESLLTHENKENIDSSSSTFKDRLNKLN